MADDAALAALATEGIPPTPKLRQLIRWCRNKSESSGDARYSTLASALQEIARPYIEDDGGVILVSIANQIDEALRDQLPGVLQESDAQIATAKAQTLRARIASLMSHNIM